MVKAIATTTINAPTEAIKRFVEIGKRDGWMVIIAGDFKTPHDAYKRLEAENSHVIYVWPDQQDERWPELSALIGPNCIQRRNFAVLEAYNRGAEIIAVVDDDNIPYAGWGQELTVGKEVEVTEFKTKLRVFDPLRVANWPNGELMQIWHRGFPVQLLADRDAEFASSGALKPAKAKRKVLVQADLWNGDPDVDAVCRIALRPAVTWARLQQPIASDKPMPFNSQNTFLHRSVIPYYFLFPAVGRMDDIWAAYMVQRQFPNSVVFNNASVYQERNPHDLSKDLENEIIGYRYGLMFVEWAFTTKNGAVMPDWFPSRAAEAYKAWRSLFDSPNPA